MLELLLDNKFTLLQMVVLLALSAFFSGTETAFFSLTRQQLTNLKNENNSTGNCIINLLKDPSRLLVTILFGNLAVNIFFFSSSTVFMNELSIVAGPAFEPVAGFIVLVLIIIFGEVLPKAIGISHSLTLAKSTAVPLLIWSRIARPAQIVLSKIAGWMEPAADHHKGNLTPAELRMVLNISKKEGNFNFQAGEVIDDIMELSSLKARDIMRHRVDIVMCPVTTRVHQAIKLGYDNRFFYLLVYQDNENTPVGVVSIKELFLNAPKNNVIRPYVHPIKFIPETKRVDQILDEMIKENRVVVGVVDEYGGLEGLINIRYILEEVVGKMQNRFSEATEQPVQQLGENTYRIRGELSLKDWGDFFYDELSEHDQATATTLGGFILHTFGGIPKEGDELTIRNLKFTVENVSRNRIVTVILHMKKEGSYDCQ